MTIIRIAGILLICMLSSALLKELKFKHTYLPVIAVMVIVICFLVNNDLSGISRVIKELSEENGIGNNITVLFKALGISYISSITSEMCKTAGEETLSKIAEAAGKLEILTLSLPLASQLIEAAKEMI